MLAAPTTWRAAVPGRAVADTATFVCHRGTIRKLPDEYSGRFGRISPGIPLALACRVFEASSESSYSQPTVMWRMRRPVGLLAHAVIGVSASKPTLVWYINDRPLGYRTFDDWTGAIQWSDRLQAQNWVAGWRLVSE